MSDPPSTVKEERVGIHMDYDEHSELDRDLHRVMGLVEGYVAYRAAEYLVGEKAAHSTVMFLIAAFFFWIGGVSVVDAKTGLDVVLGLGSGFLGVCCLCAAFGD